jgi:hypothetical protein
MTSIAYILAILSLLTSGLLLLRVRAPAGFAFLFPKLAARSPIAIMGGHGPVRCGPGRGSGSATGLRLACSGVDANPGWMLRPCCEFDPISDAQDLGGADSAGFTAKEGFGRLEERPLTEW